MKNTLAKNWWVVGLRGLMSIAFGILAFVYPGLTLVSLVLIFGFYAVLDGASNIYTAFQNRDANDKWWIFLLEGIVSVIAGILAFIIPGMTAVILLYIIAFWAILTGVMEIVGAVRLRKEIENEWFLALTGVLSVLFGILLMVSPATGALAVVWMIGIYAIVFGIMMIALAWKLRNNDIPTDIEETRPSSSTATYNI